LYLPSGARWEASKRKYAHDCFNAVQHDLCEKGDVVALILGDFNLATEDSSILQSWQAKGPMIDANCSAPESIRWNPTCHQGKGSRIDHIFAYKNSIDLVQGYDVIRTACSTNHSMISIYLTIPKAMQIRRTQRPVAPLPELTQPASDSDIFPDSMPAEFHTFLNSGDTTKAFQVWSQHAEKIPFQVANLQHHNVKPSNIHRGEVKFHDTRKYPRIIGEQATTLKDRQLWKAMCRAVECQKTQTGYRRDKTWQKLFKIIPILPTEYHSEFQRISGQPVSVDLAKRVETLLRNIYSSQCKENTVQRINNWKKRMRLNEAESAKWLRTKNHKKVLAVSSTEQGPSANSQSRIETIREAWSKFSGPTKMENPPFASS
jgi:hypothetical protein